MNEERAKILIEIEKVGGQEYEKLKSIHTNFLNSFLDSILEQFDTAKSDEEQDEIFKYYVTCNYKIPKEDKRDLLKYGIEQEKNKFKIMSLYEQERYIQDDLFKYRRKYVFNCSEEIQNIPIEKIQPSRHMMN